MEGNAGVVVVNIDRGELGLMHKGWSLVAIGLIPCQHMGGGNGVAMALMCCVRGDHFDELMLDHDSSTSCRLLAGY